VSGRAAGREGRIAKVLGPNAGDRQLEKTRRYKIWKTHGKIIR
jgi:hypothetical protein